MKLLHKKTHKIYDSDEFDEYDKWNEDAQKEHDNKQAELRRIEKFLKECENHKTDFLLEKEGIIKEVI